VVTTLVGQEVGHRQAGVAGADDQDIDGFAHALKDGPPAAHAQSQD